MKTTLITSTEWMLGSHTYFTNTCSFLFFCCCWLCRLAAWKLHTYRRSLWSVSSCLCLSACFQTARTPRCNWKRGVVLSQREMSFCWLCYKWNRPWSENSVSCLCVPYRTRWALAETGSTKQTSSKHSLLFPFLFFYIYIYVYTYAYLFIYLFK